MRWAKLYRYKYIAVYLPIWTLAGVVFFALSALWMPLAPTTVTLSSGPVDGMYHVHALRYAKLLQERGLDVQVASSVGSGENLSRLRDADKPAHIAFVQGGYATQDNAAMGQQRLRLLTVANIDIEPIWIFSRLRDLDALQQLQGLRVSIGQVGSGSRQVAMRLLEQVRLEPKDLVVSETTGLSAVKALQNGSIDASIFVAAPGAPVVRAMLSAPSVYLVQLKRSAALSERIHFLSPRLVAQGMLGGTPRVPAQDMVMLSTIASVVVREDLHPAIIQLVAWAAQEVHSEGGIFYKPGEFPQLKNLDFPSSPVARRTLAAGLPWLEQNTSFVTAQWLRRLMFMGLPLAFLAWLACRLVPAYMRWLLESHVNRWYGELKYIEYDLENQVLSGLDFSRHHIRLRKIESAVTLFVPPTDYMKRMYILRQHIHFVRHKLLAKRGR